MKDNAKDRLAQDLAAKGRPTRQPPLDSAVETRDKTSGSDLRKLNEVKQATGKPLDDPEPGAPDANVNTPRNGPVVER
jgi:hypothetical protein